MSQAPFVELLRRRLSDEALLVTDPDVMAAYSTDRAPWVSMAMPAVVVSPSHLDDVRRVLEVAAEHRIAVVPRGAGSGLSGGANALCGCIVLSTQRLRAEPVIRVADRLAHLTAGYLTAEVKQLAASHGLLYPPDPASSAFCSIGGNIATNAGGLCCVRYGVTRDWVRKVEVVLPGGDVVEFGHTTAKGVVGYDMTSLIVGSEGTLGIVTAATLSLTPAVAGHATIVAYFTDMTHAGQAVLGCLERPTPPALLEIMDRTTLRAVEQWKPMDLYTDAAALLLIQVPLDATADTEVAALVDTCRTFGATEVFSSTEPAEADMLLQARRLAFEALEKRGVPLLEDVAVDVSRLPELLETIEEIGRRHRVTIGTFGHAGEGNMHPIVATDDASSDARNRARNAFEAIVAATLDLGGTVSGEHGVGLLKLPFVNREISERALALMTSVKAAFDPLSIMNPGKAVPLPQTADPTSVPDQISVPVTPNKTEVAKIGPPQQPRRPRQLG
jgi:glycolate oxidase